MRDRSHIFMAVALPPPVHGQAVVNQAIADRLRDTGSSLKIRNIAPTNLTRGLSYHGRRFIRVFQALIALPVEVRQSHILRGSRSELGIFYNILLVGAARVYGYKIVLHHHTSAHTLKFRPAFSWLARAAGRQSVHVALGPAMARDLSNYSGVNHVIVASNACHVKAVPDEDRDFGGRAFG